MRYLDEKKVRKQLSVRKRSDSCEIEVESGFRKAVSKAAAKRAPSALPDNGAVHLAQFVYEPLNEIS